jgi:hypothetical protein
MDVIQLIREHEKKVLSDTTQLNSILDIKKLIKTHGDVTPVVLAGLHSMRRIFVYALDSHLFFSGSTHDKILQRWLVKQYSSFKYKLLNWVQQSNEEVIGPSIRTLFEVYIHAVPLNY